MDRSSFKSLFGVRPLELADLDESTTTLELAHYHTGFSAVEWGHIRRLRSLTKLFLLWSGVNDVDLEHVATLSALTELDLTGTNVSDRGLEIISKLTSLKVLCLAHCHYVTGRGLEHLKSLTDLTWLVLPVQTAPRRRDPYRARNVPAVFSTTEVEELQQVLPRCNISW